jgi:cytochrome oxidase assembly protein ShyY1
MFHRKWLLTTLLVFLGIALCIRLGIWQLDRLESRRAFNAQVESKRALPALDLNQEGIDSITGMEWRSVKVAGEYDFENQIALRNQYYSDQYGYHLWTPLSSTLRHSLRSQGRLRQLFWLTAAGFLLKATPHHLTGVSMMSQA